MAYGDTLDAVDGLALLTDIFLGFIAFVIANFDKLAILVLIIAFVLFLTKKLS